MSEMPSNMPRNQTAVTGILDQRTKDKKTPIIPLTRIQPQFGNGRIVSEKMIFEIPSTIRNTITSSVSVSTLSAGLRRNIAPTMMNRATETS
jgi:hypothetical protein